MIQTKPSKPFLRAFFGLSLAASVFFVVACEDETQQLTEVPQQSTSAAEHMALDSNFEITRTSNTNKDPKPDFGVSESGQTIVIKTREFVYVIQKFKDKPTFEKAAEIVGKLEPESDKFEKELVEKLGEISGETLSFKYLSTPPQADVPPAPPATVDIPSTDGSNSDQIFEVVEEQPRPEGGMEAFYKFVGEELRYPQQAERLGVEGRVFIQFIVDEQGNTSDVKAVKGIGAGCDLEAVRVIKLSKWEPGTQRGKPVKVRIIMPISFKLNKLTYL
jgi:TonB family protein